MKRIRVRYWEDMPTKTTRLLAWCLLAGLVAPVAIAGQGVATRPRSSVTGTMQTRPGGALEEAEVKVHEVPVDLPMVAAAAAPLEDSDLVLGVVVEGEPVAFPIRFLAMYEIVNQRIGETPLAPSW